MLLAFDEPLGACEPSGRAARFSSEEQAQTQPESAANRAQVFAGVQMGVVGPIERLEILVVPSDQVRRHRQQFEIFGRQRNHLSASESAWWASAQARRL